MIYDRQQTGIEISPPGSVTVIGVGGVGSWVAYDLAMTGVGKLVLVDPDRVEDSNLNRTPYKLEHVGVHKVMAMVDIIAERRDSTIVVPIPKKVEEIDEIDMHEAMNTFVTIDCRDTVPLQGIPEELLSSPPVITGGYDGSKITLHTRPSLDSVWGDGPTRYTETPSWLVPPQVIAAIITTALCVPEVRRKLQSEQIRTWDWNKIALALLRRKKL